MRRFLPSSFLLLFLVVSACSSDRQPVDHQRASPQKHGIEVLSVWQEKSETAGKQHIAILNDDVFTHSDHFLLFGNKNGKLQVRDFIGLFSIFVNPGNTEKAEDNFYKLTATFLTKDVMEVALKGQDGSEFDLVYERLPTGTPVAADAIAAAEQFYKKFDTLLDSKVKTLTDLKAFVRLHIRSHDFGPNDERALDWQFVIEPNEIEGNVALAAAKKKLAGVEIKIDGSDAISKHFQKQFGKEWTKPEDLPEPEEAFAAALEDEQAPFFLLFEKDILGVEEGPIRDGLKKFADFTVQVMNPFECEGFFAYVRDFHWVLSDGSILSYTTAPECD